MAKKANKPEKLIKEFFDMLKLDAEFELTEEDDIIGILIKTDDTGIVIGYHGETLEALQLIISLILAKDSGAYKRVSIEVGDYKKNRSEWLEKLAGEARERALTDGKEVYLSDLKAWERRVIHLLLQDDKEVISESSGEGKDRVLVIKPR